MRKIALVTGASSLLGKSCSERLQQSGCTVYRIGRGDVFRNGSLLNAGPQDDIDDQVAEFIVDEVWNKEGGIHALVNCADHVLTGAVEDTSLEEARLLFEVNFFDQLRVCNTVLPLMREQGAGLVINAVLRSYPDSAAFQGVYSASSAALEALTAALGEEVGPFGVHVVLVRGGRLAAGGHVPAARQAQWSEVYRRAFEEAWLRSGRDEVDTSVHEAALLVDRLVRESCDQEGNLEGAAKARGKTRVVRQAHRRSRVHGSQLHPARVAGSVLRPTGAVPGISFVGDWQSGDRHVVEGAIVEFELRALLAGRVLSPSRWLCTARRLPSGGQVFVVHRGGAEVCLTARTSAELAERLAERERLYVPFMS